MGIKFIEFVMLTVINLQTTVPPWCILFTKLSFAWHRATSVEHVVKTELSTLVTIDWIILRSWWNGYRQKKCTRWPKFNYRTRLFAFLVALILLGKVCHQLLSLSLLSFGLIVGQTRLFTFFWWKYFKGILLYHKAQKDNKYYFSSYLLTH